MAVAVGALLVPLSTWFFAVDRTVTEPYLDEVFHVRQAQHYCQGHFDVWDPKITTPPGLYLLSYAFSRLESFQEYIGLGHLRLVPLDCSITGLRALNAVGLILLLLVVRLSYLQRASPETSAHHSLFDHSALNVALFPPLFFFSALYYTDVWSALSVLASYCFLTTAYRDKYGHWMRGTGLLALGLVSLMFRQTNIFWVTAFPAGLVLVKELDRGHEAIRNSMHRRTQGFGDSLYSIAKTSWKMAVIYDPPVRDAQINGTNTSPQHYHFAHPNQSPDYLLTIISIAACLLGIATQPKRLASLFLALAPFLLLAALFLAFILWNGSVVLGDKANHTATLHLPQMLYLWPFTAFFSWPLLLPYLLLTPVVLLTWLPLFSALECAQRFKRAPSLLPRLLLALLLLTLTSAIIHYNTLVHPFTLADNRHYIFYVFRLLLRPWYLRYAASPLYLLSAWACLQTLGTEPTDTQLFAPHPSDLERRLPVPNAQHSARLSFTLVFLATSTLQLVTAPLVEPRYFILPWVFWRLHIPLRIPVWRAGKKRNRGARWSWERWWAEYDHRLWIETAWLVAINAGTGYVFLFWGFAWPQEPGKVQRFMW
ncbi:glucosyltransferase [Friedmanniomyces endolithicus]|uniref:Dol-P-Glc:Glc(2)Man(9)GlcNAc(2)-PP-Dol alpha-1,2-glucosyltransferase n=1 Tax=Friedmanniomyces endolithicus TaxID=329885 RepID=A0AAN6JBZ7_9PEZI|nr:glucosyltransferase [Friedmanniomyces endolithicus]KAK0275048.1 glucosyltransferase [Friedmanniomyces endolithicus]KAK0324036.1 glucosyltransferase [Friedmanniomyces endolithicus]KAK0926614.1 glucosyltransferase [Friedmanniomyces endolithicus]KAK0981602.1 glucosyltransferase [Friedmanniomyces endolithicus]